MSHIVHTDADGPSSRIGAVPGPEPLRSLPGAPAIASLLALLVPSRCAVCDEPRKETGGGGVCSACWAALPRLSAGAACPLCALPGDGSPCPACRRHPPPVARTLAFGLYAGGLKTLLQAFKFRGWDLLAAPCGARLAAAAEAASLADGADALVPVPSTRRRNRARGYDPAALLAESAARRLGLPARALLARTRETAPQSELPAARRHANVDGAFAASASARGRVLVLVDDVATTGATLFSAARALAQAGAADIRGLVLARTPEPEPT
jgi:ComF family protein